MDVLEREVPSGSEDEFADSDESSASDDEYFPDEEQSDIENNPSPSMSTELNKDSDESTDGEDSVPSTSKNKNRKNAAKDKNKPIWDWVKKDLPFLETPEDELIPRGPAVHAKTPIKMFTTLFPDDLVEMITFETNRNRIINGSKCKPVTKQDIYTFMGILMYMSVVHLPFRRMYWSPLTRQETIANAMSVNKFEYILSMLHFCDNSIAKEKDQPGYDRLHKIRKLLVRLNETFQDCAFPEKCQCIDEQMVPFKGRHSLKVYMTKKPVKWGYKMWARAGRSGYVYELELFGDNQIENLPNLPDELGQLGKVVMRLTKNVPEGTFMFFDNFFASPELLVELKKRNLGGTCTFQKKRTRGCPLTEDKALGKQGRGAYDFRTEKTKEFLICKWYDNKPVLVGSNVHGVEPSTDVRRFDRKDRRHILVERPRLIGEYNKNMGGVDKCDMMLALYRTKLKTKKWYKRIFTHLLDLCVVNSWFLYRQATKSKMQMVHFKLELARSLIKTHQEVDQQPEVPMNPVKRMRSAKDVCNSARFDGMNHFPKQTQSCAQRCKMDECGRKSTYICLKCHVSLCIDGKTDCFYKFHNK